LARVDVSMSSDVEPGDAWKLASDLNRFDEWMTIFGGWRGPIPSTVQEGACVSSCINVKGFRNIVHWTVTRYDEPKSIELQGRGRGGIRLAVTMIITDNHPGSNFRLTADLEGGVLSGPVGGLVARILRSDVRKSVNNLAALPLPLPCRVADHHSRSTCRIRLGGKPGQRGFAPARPGRVVATGAPAGSRWH
jgi:Polyketide cyclase / dehydrase and lipid transport